ncbi:MAG: undecaprenyl-diphosphate phosphatase [archaeon]
MNELITSIIIAIVQGLTEWLPVSSSGHMVVFEKLLNYQGGLTFEVALHFGTLMAVFVYFGSDIVDIIRDLLMGRFKSENGKLGIYVLIATIPAAIVGYLLRGVFEQVFNSLLITAFGFAITGVFLFIAGTSRKGGSLKAGNSFMIGVAQIFALFPGISRSGATIGSGYLFGLDERQAIKFSFLMSIPIILGANILEIGGQTLPSEMIWATLVAFLVGLGTIHLLYGKVLVSRKNLKWFGTYALALAVVIFGYLLVS